MTTKYTTKEQTKPTGQSSGKSHHAPDFTIRNTETVFSLDSPEELALLEFATQIPFTTPCERSFKPHIISFQYKDRENSDNRSKKATKTVSVFTLQYAIARGESHVTHSEVIINYKPSYIDLLYLNFLNLPFCSAQNVIHRAFALHFFEQDFIHKLSPQIRSIVPYDGGLFDISARTLRRDRQAIIDCRPGKTGRLAFWYNSIEQLLWKLGLIPNNSNPVPTVSSVTNSSEELEAEK